MDLRKHGEKEFYNKIRGEDLGDADKEYYHANRKWYSINEKSVRFVDHLLGKTCRGKRVLDYCCGNGVSTLRVTETGAAEITGIDISEVSIDSAEKSASEKGVSGRVKFMVMDAEKTDFEDSSFDIIYGNGVLHHLDLEKAYSEIARILSPGGMYIGVEALGHNPLIRLYRKKTPHLRTGWEAEHILRKRDIFCAEKYFHKVRVLAFFHLASVMAVPLRGTAVFMPLLSVLDVIDSVLLKIPFIRWQAWQAVFILEKPINKV